mmetsp:Transcript_21495/g.64159  ORF Transcript_21495/g.64159 Transcript_21495/m.64159 type:complete len:261 (+) Transcript_21495:1041-1823(+)
MRPGQPPHEDREVGHRGGQLRHPVPLLRPAQQVDRPASGSSGIPLQAAPLPALRTRASGHALLQGLLQALHLPMRREVPARAQGGVEVRAPAGMAGRIDRLRDHTSWHRLAHLVPPPVLRGLGRDDHRCAVHALGHWTGAAAAAQPARHGGRRRAHAVCAIPQLPERHLAAGAEGTRVRLPRVLAADGDGHVQPPLRLRPARPDARAHLDRGPARHRSVDDREAAVPDALHERRRAAQHAPHGRPLAGRTRSPAARTTEG